MDEQARALLIEGEELAKAKESALYKFLVERAEREARAAADKLMTADAENPQLIRALQAEVHRAWCLVTWVDQAIDQARMIYENHATFEGE